MTGWAAHRAIILLSLAAAALPLNAQAHTHSHTGNKHPATHNTSHTSTGHTNTGHTNTGHVGGHSRHAAADHAGRQDSQRLAQAGGRYRHGRHGVRYAGISCVPFARAESGITLTGNAATWWDEADGRYARGNAPESGSVLNFRANSSMHLGHVAVVRNVINSREIEIDQANWWGPGAGRGGVSRDVAVVDVSPHNDWTAVRVALGHSGTFGSVYPTYGFIYGRPDGSDPQPQVMTASASGDEIIDPASLNPAPRDLRSHGRSRHTHVHHFAHAAAVEVAEAPADAPAGPLQMDAPDRSLK